MQIASVTSSNKTVTFDEGDFAVDGQAVDIGQVIEYDQLGVLTWVSEDVRSWAYQVEQGASVQASAVSRSIHTTSASSSKTVDTTSTGYRLGAWWRTHPRGRWVAVVCLVALLSIPALGSVGGFTSSSSSPEGLWFAGSQPSSGKPVFFLEIAGDEYSVGSADNRGKGTTYEKGSATYVDGKLTLSPEWVFTDLGNFWGAGHGKSLVCSFSVKGDVMTLSDAPQGTMQLWIRD